MDITNVGNRKTSRTPTESSPSIALKPRRIGLVARDHSLGPRKSARGFKGCITDIVQACSDAGCDGILFSPWSSDRVHHGILFPRATRHQWVILGVGVKGQKESIQVWDRRRPEPLRLSQVFGKSSEASKQLGFMRDLK